MSLFSLNPDYSKRVYGLDVFRAVAILLVVIGHGGFIIDKALPGFPWIKLIDGVELFFVLSGFLIGTILMKMYEKEESLSLSSLVSFWKRRWFRTLPNYYLILIVNAIFVYTGIINGKFEEFNWKFFLFLQNFNSYFVDFFWESWSLTIEEWFYILTPLSLLIFHFILRKSVSRKNIWLILILVYLVLPVLYRVSISGEEVDNFWYDVKFRKVVLTRLDAIMYGVLFAWIRFYHKTLFEKYALPLFITGFIMMYGVMHLAVPDHVGFYAKTVYFSITGLGAAMMLPYAAGIKTARTKFAKVMTHISLVSYSMYLINLSVVAQVIEKHFYPETKLESVIMYIIFWAAVVVISTLLFKYFEKPVMDLRDKSTMKVEV